MILVPSNVFRQSRRVRNVVEIHLRFLAANPRVNFLWNSRPAGIGKPVSFSFDSPAKLDSHGAANPNTNRINSTLFANCAFLLLPKRSTIASGLTLVT